MAVLVPPPPRRLPGCAGNDDKWRTRRFRLRLTQVNAAVLTVLLTSWLCTLSPIPAICALLAAKHVLVAILVMGLGLDAPGPSGRPGPRPRHQPGQPWEGEEQ